MFTLLYTNYIYYDLVELRLCKLSTGMYCIARDSKYTVFKIYIIYNIKVSYVSLLWYAYQTLL